MKRLIITSVLVLLGAIGDYIYLTRPCIAGMCPDRMCTSNSDCGGEPCFCLKGSGETTGSCH